MFALVAFNTQQVCLLNLFVQLWWRQKAKTYADNCNLFIATCTFNFFPDWIKWILFFAFLPPWFVFYGFDYEYLLNYIYFFSYAPAAFHSSLSANPHAGYPLIMIKAYSPTPGRCHHHSRWWHSRQCNTEYRSWP